MPRLILSLHGRCARRAIKRLQRAAVHASGTRVHVSRWSAAPLEGLGTPDKPHTIQKAWIEEQAVQFGYCMNEHIMNAKVLLDKNPRPTEAAIRKGLGMIRRDFF